MNGFGDGPSTRVLLDADGVMLNFIGPVLELVYEVTGTRFYPEEVTEYAFAESIGLSADHAREVKRLISHRPLWWSSLPACPGAVEGVQRIMEVAEVYVVTSPWDSCTTWMWERKALVKKLFGIGGDRVIPTIAKHVCFGDFIVDDKVEALREWSKAWEKRGGRAIKWKTLHNTKDGWGGWSTNSWIDLRSMIDMRNGRG